MDTDTTPMPANVRRTFNRIPEAYTVLVEMGHAYGKARYPGKCPMTGMMIRPGDPIRKVVCWTREGRQLDAYVHHRSAEFWSFHGGSEGLTGETGDMPWSSWRRFDGESFRVAVSGLDDFALGTTIIVADVSDCFPTMLVKAWRRTTKGWESYRAICSAAEYAGTARSDSTSKQLQAAFARRTKGVAYRIDLPR